MSTLDENPSDIAASTEETSHQTTESEEIGNETEFGIPREEAASSGGGSEVPIVETVTETEDGEHVEETIVSEEFEIVGDQGETQNEENANIYEEEEIIVDEQGNEVYDEEEILVDEDGNEVFEDEAVEDRSIEEELIDSSTQHSSDRQLGYAIPGNYHFESSDEDIPFMDSDDEKDLAEEEARERARREADFDDDEEIEESESSEDHNGNGESGDFHHEDLRTTNEDVIHDSTQPTSIPSGSDEWEELPVPVRTGGVNEVRHPDPEEGQPRDEENQAVDQRPAKIAPVPYPTKPVKESAATFYWNCFFPSFDYPWPCRIRCGSVPGFSSKKLYQSAIKKVCTHSSAFRTTRLRPDNCIRSNSW